MTYAKNTTVSVSKTKMDIEAVLSKAGAVGFAYANEGSRAMIGFRIEGSAGRVLAVQMKIDLPDQADWKYTRTATGLVRSAEQARKAWEQDCRSRYRQLLLIIRAKLEAVEVGITTIEREFMPDLRLTDGRTLEQHVAEQMEAIEAGGQALLLPGGSGA